MGYRITQNEPHASAQPPHAHSASAAKRELDRHAWVGAVMHGMHALSPEHAAACAPHIESAHD